MLDLPTPTPTRPAAAPRREPTGGPRPAPLLDGQDWLGELRREVESHPGVNHLLLSRLATGPYTRCDYRAFGLQHYALVGQFTRYMELLLLKAPSSEQKLWLAKVLVDEYGEGSDGQDHTTLYRAYLDRVGATDEEIATRELRPETWWFVGEHLRICREEPFLVGLGALGPGHEWAIPKMFSHVIPGLARAGVDVEERLYFDLHTEQDVDHGAWMTEALAKLARTPETRRQVRRGALLSLAARFRFWTGVEREIVRARQPVSTEVVRRGLLGRPRAARHASGGCLADLHTAVERTLAGQPWPVPLPATDPDHPEVQA